MRMRTDNHRLKGAAMQTAAKTCHGVAVVPHVDGAKLLKAADMAR